MSHKIDPPISSHQRQFIVGTILGGSSLVKPANGINCYLSMRGQDFEWLSYKANFLASLASTSPFTDDTTRRWHSMCYPIFGKIRNEFYDDKGERRLKIETLDSLKDSAFAVWYGDCGKMDFKNRIVLNTHIWGEKNSKIIVRYFKALDWKSEIFLDRGCFRIRLDEPSSKAFFALAEPHLPVWFLNGIEK